jgi:HEAT repeat protein
VVAVFSILLPCAVMAGVTDEEHAKALTVSELKEKAKAYDPGAIRELARRKESSARDLLKKIAEEPDLKEDKTARYRTPKEMKELGHVNLVNGSHEEAKVALAALGDQKYFDALVSGLKSEDGHRRAKCIGWLGKTGSKKAVKHLIALLDDKKPAWVNKKGIGSASFSYHASLALRDLLPDVFDGFVKKHGGKGMLFTDDWKEWWTKNKTDFEKDS